MNDIHLAINNSEDDLIRHELDKQSATWLCQKCGDRIKVQFQQLRDEILFTPHCSCGEK